MISLSKVKRNVDRTCYMITGVVVLGSCFLFAANDAQNPTVQYRIQFGNLHTQQVEARVDSIPENKGYTQADRGEMNKLQAAVPAKQLDPILKAKPDHKPVPPPATPHPIQKASL